jgi:hypothetical protein
VDPDSNILVAKVVVFPVVIEDPTEWARTHKKALALRSESEGT